VSQESDDQLIEKIVGGDERALLALYDRYASRVHALALRIIGEPMAAEEITQDVFLKVWTRARSYIAERGMFVVWLLSIARHAALDRVRLENRRPPNTEEGTPEDQAEPDHDPDEARWRSLRLIVQSLPLEQRQVIEFAYFHGMSHGEIAEHTGLPLGTVKSRLRAAMEELRKQWFGDN